METNKEWYGNGIRENQTKTQIKLKRTKHNPDRCIILMKKERKDIYNVTKVFYFR